MTWLYVIGFAVAMLIALLMTPLVKRFAFWVGAVDAPNHRKVHSRIMPRLGGLAIFIAFVAAYFVVSPAMDALKSDVVFGLLVGGAIVVVIGALDDRFDLSPKLKLLGQILAASVVVYSGVVIDLVNVPFGDGVISLEWLAVPLTIFWIVGVTNAINLIDGLDGLSAGVSGIATCTILVLALMMGNVTVVLLCAVLLGSIGGFLFYNFHPAKIFMGDSGALFLGFTLATLSVLGFKQATVVSLLVPIMILGVPLSDTFFAIMRRWVNNLPISVADKSHLHHCLLQLGFSHRSTVLIIYGISLVFGTSAVLLSYMSQQQTLWGTVLLVTVLLCILVLGAEAIGIISKTKKPVLQFLNKAMKTMQLNTKSRNN
ncbi:MraY family glycosyltransferase [Paenibacillus validus]|uniref:Undecaprenyl-phosphate alpha-N-acetylglucosaminyl 1-phosphate transferase n=1 Tax=Paenibacillus validus TaxID=44253 RepID=A0A7X2ZCR8_9BACL|nr:MraY family glycosyltransferase [Paenibacillus validus]MED4600717.1 MraY family glycosyltransferase [Paenibacillus validus]MED4606766.1 MraY family glycosyltransferase [Paenibacillus validus]MUG72454.1 undecaprenyl-phosphate alpha-N-acetylglucosaminyl 1-phosphate transferase [Paenibacillus validus]